MLLQQKSIDTETQLGKENASPDKADLAVLKVANLLILLYSLNCCEKV